MNLLEEKLDELSGKYFDLVSLARKYPEDFRLPGMAGWRRELQAKYPQECKDLASDSEGDWAHGFNSGMLACIRFVQTAQARECCDDPLTEAEALQMAVDEFPFLDT